MFCHHCNNDVEVEDGPYSGKYCKNCGTLIGMQKTK